MISNPPPPEAPVLRALRLQSALTIEGLVGTTNWILYADALRPSAWTVLTNVVVTTSPYVYVDTEASSMQRFYLAVAGATPPETPKFMPDLDRFADIRPGTFTMGSPNSEQGREGDEGPLTTVTLTRGFWMGRYEVTQQEYQAVMGSNPSRWNETNRPVEQVSWHEAANYCGKLTARERTAGRLPGGWEYRLPTEAEWEYACRAGTSTRFSFGDDPTYSQLGQYAWLSTGGSMTHPVGLKRANPWGLYDMHGNVWEWCGDRYETYRGGTVTDPKGGGTGSARVLRGGSWYDVGQNCRSADRGSRDPSYRYSNLGFRVVLAEVP